MASTSLWDYIFIRTSIFLLHLVAPLSTLYSLARGFVRFPVDIPRILEIWLALEAVFYLVVYIPLNLYLQRAASHPPTLCRNDRRILFRRCHNNLPDPDRYLRKWFRDAPAAEVKRENVKDFFRWAFLNTAEPDPAYDEELEEYVGDMEKMLGRNLEPGRGNAKCLRLTLDKVEMLHRSLTWYLCVFIVDAVVSGYLRHHSFDFHRTSCLAVFPPRPFGLFGVHYSSAKCLTYWHRPHTSNTRLPILFIHGIGVGLYPYTEFLVELNAKDREDRSGGELGIIAVEIMSICRKPTNANEYLLSYFGSKDIGVAHTLFRRFFWAENILWKEDIQNHRVAVSLAGSDLIVNAKVIRAYLTGGDDWTLANEDSEDGDWKGDGLDVLWFPGFHHGQVFDKRNTRTRLVDVVRRFCIEE
ncbi:hypothetical protein DL768_006349 [Monosporascus sp. mg162]|nr:hypothetical protein DL768_006349 [Monosporascus sp. mg162]